MIEIVEKEINESFNWRVFLLEIERRTLEKVEIECLGKIVLKLTYFKLSSLIVVFETRLYYLILVSYTRPSIFRSWLVACSI